ncbi:MAG: NRDE family protein [Burkholderiaceae bacterium]
MCLIAFALDPEADIPLFIASNRDEFFDRPTRPLHRWTLPNGTEVVAGRDERDGGTWLGLSPNGRVAMLTNVRSAHMAAAPRSRGELPNRWLSGEADWMQFQTTVAPADYGGFNLVVGDARTGLWAWMSNRDPADPHETVSGQKAPALFSRPLVPGVYGLSNATLDTAWPKTVALKAALADALANPFGKDEEWALLQTLGSARPSPAGHLPTTGVSPEWETPLSSPFVEMPERGYGTRSSLLVRTRRSASPSRARLGWDITLDEWSHGTDATQRATWRDDQRRTETLGW